MVDYVHRETKPKNIWYFSVNSFRSLDKIFTYLLLIFTPTTLEKYKFKLTLQYLNKTLQYPIVQNSMYHRGFFKWSSACLPRNYKNKMYDLVTFCWPKKTVHCSWMTVRCEHYGRARQWYIKGVRPLQPIMVCFLLLDTTAYFRLVECCC